MRKPSTITGWTTAALAVSVAGIATLGWLWTKPAAAQTSAPDPVVYLDQAWSQADRETYYQISQGSSVMDYAVFLNLELANSQELFRSDANSDRYGLITQPANPRTNPDGLPVGLAKAVSTEGKWKGEYIGLNCAACHNAQLTYKGKKIRVDGGVGNTFDFVAYIGGLNRCAAGDSGRRSQVRPPGLATWRCQSGSEERIAQKARGRREACRLLPFQGAGRPDDGRPFAHGCHQRDRQSVDFRSNPIFPRTCTRRWRRPSLRSSGTPRRVRGRNGAECSRIRSTATSPR